MSQKEKKNKRSYLRDFEEVSDGSYVYTGKTWHAEPCLRRRLLIKLWLLQSLMLVAAVLPGFVTTAGLLNTFYVIIPYVFWLISVFYLAYTLGNMTFGGNPLRDYVYVRSVARLAFLSMLPLGGAVCTALSLLLFLLRGGGGNGAGTCFVCCAVQILSSLYVRRCRVTEIWSETEITAKDNKKR